jgi:uncharacterized protein (TIGR02246 family)
VAKFTAEQAIAYVTIQQLIHDWADELDITNGLKMADLVTESCHYTVRGEPRLSRDEVVKFYQGRLNELEATPAGVPDHRHILSNLRADFRNDDHAAIEFKLVYFTTAGVSTGLEHADPAAVADVRMEVRREADGHWRISRFDSNQLFRRVPK